MQQIEIDTLLRLLENLTKAVEQLRETIADEVGGLADYTLECGAYRRAVRLECLRALLRDKCVVQTLYREGDKGLGDMIRLQMDNMEEVLVGPHVPCFTPPRRKEGPSDHA